MKTQASKPNRSIRFEAEDLNQAEKLGLDVSTIAREALRKEILSKKKKCPTCGHSLKV